MNQINRFLSLFEDKDINAVVAERHDIVLLFDANKCNPNGDPDTGNMPRLQPDTLTGLVTDVCLKRKIRNFFANYTPQGNLRAEGAATDDGYNLFIHEGAVIQKLMDAPTLEAKAKAIFLRNTDNGRDLTEADWEASKTKENNKDAVQPASNANSPQAKPEGDSGNSTVALSAQPDVSTSATLPGGTENAGAAETGEVAQPSDENGTQKTKKTKKAKKVNEGRSYPEYKDRAFRDAVCAAYFDVRYFGQVVSTEGPLKGSFQGQIRGPIQITFAESLDKILQLDFSITRCAVASEKEAAKKNDDNRTMGRKYEVAYGLYRAHIHFSPAFAAKTGFTYGDLANFFFALTRAFGDYNVDISAARPGGISVVGLVDFEHQSSLGNAPAHKLFELVKVSGKKEDGKFASGSNFPQGIEDYEGAAPDGDLYIQENDYGVVTGCSPEKQKDNQTSSIKARRLVWEIPAVKPQEKSTTATDAASS